MLLLNVIQGNELLCGLELESFVERINQTYLELPNLGSRTGEKKRREKRKFQSVSVKCILSPADYATTTNYVIARDFHIVIYLFS